MIGGVTAIYVHDGRVVAHVSDFNQSRPGGYEIQEAQSHRARVALALELVRVLSSPLLSDAVDGYIAEQILKRLDGMVFVLPVRFSEPQRPEHGREDTTERYYAENGGRSERVRAWLLRGAPGAIHRAQRRTLQGWL